MNTIQKYTCMLSVLMLPSTAWADSLQSMERSRSALLNVCRDGNITPEARASKISTMSRSHLDMERLVTRDDALGNKDDPRIKAALEDYSMTFIVHSSKEAGMPLCAHWVELSGLTSDAIKNARKGWR